MGISLLVELKIIKVHGEIHATVSDEIIDSSPRDNSDRLQETRGDGALRNSTYFSTSAWNPSMVSRALRHVMPHLDFIDRFYRRRLRQCKEST